MCAVKEPELESFRQSYVGLNLELGVSVTDLDWRLRACRAIGYSCPEFFASILGSPGAMAS